MEAWKHETMKGFFGIQFENVHETRKSTVGTEWHPINHQRFLTSPPFPALEVWGSPFPAPKCAFVRKFATHFSSVVRDYSCNLFCSARIDGRKNAPLFMVVAVMCAQEHKTPNTILVYVPHYCKVKLNWIDTMNEIDQYDRSIFYYSICSRVCFSFSLKEDEEHLNPFATSTAFLCIQSFINLLGEWTWKFRKLNNASTTVWHSLIGILKKNWCKIRM